MIAAVIITMTILAAVGLVEIIEMIKEEVKK